MMNLNNKYYSFFANCIPVKGATRTLICDLQRSIVDFIPNEIMQILMDQKEEKIGDILGSFDDENAKILLDYFQFLIDKDYLLLVENKDELAWFPEIELRWETPETINNAILEIQENIPYNMENLINELSFLGCESIELRSYKNISKESIEHILSLMEGSRIENVFLILPYQAEMDSEYSINLINRFPRIIQLNYHSTPSEEIFKLNSKTEMIRAHWKTQKVDSSNHCGFISFDSFSVNLKFYLESKLFNNCLYKKVSVDINGEIKNCPSTTKSFGNYISTSISEVLKQDEFKSLWNIKKDDIEDCRVCEFRYICSDCRAFTVGDEFSKPAKCGYNPYTGIWTQQNVSIPH